MSNKPCGNPNCQKCSNIYVQPPARPGITSSEAFNQRNPRIRRDRSDFYPPNRPPHPEILETYGTPQRIEESDFITDFPGNSEMVGPQPHHHPPNIMPEGATISDAELLDYLLKKYHLNKDAVIHSIIKQKEYRFKLNLMHDFYHQFKKIGFKPIKEQYRIFKEWNCNGPYISREELQDYYEKYVNKAR